MVRVFPLAICGWCGLFAAAVNLNTPAAAQEAAPATKSAAGWVGQKIIPKPGAKLTVPGSRTALAMKDAGPLPWKITAEKQDWVWMGKAWVKKNQVQKVGDTDRERQLINFSEKIRTEPNNQWHHVNRAFMRLPDDSENAVADLTNALRIDPKDFYILSTRAHRWETLGKMENALADWNTAVQLSPQGLAGRAVFFGHLGRHKEALADLNQAVAASPKDFNVLAERAWLLSTCPADEIRNGEQALSDARNAYALQVWHNTVSALAAAYAETGNFGAAVRAQEAAIELCKKQGGPPLVKEAESRLALYRSEKPYRQQPQVESTAAQPVEATVVQP
jgi:tetratricopeptide (TPR) repeat protein